MKHDVEVREEMISELLEKLGKGKHLGRIVLGPSLRECRQQRSGPVTDVIKCLSNTGKSVKSGKEVISH